MSVESTCAAGRSSGSYRCRALCVSTHIVWDLVAVQAEDIDIGLDTVNSVSSRVVIVTVPINIAIKA